MAKNEGISFILDAVGLKCDGVTTRAMTEPVYVEIGLAWKKDKYLSYASRALIAFPNSILKTISNSLFIFVPQQITPIILQHLVAFFCRSIKPYFDWYP